jgi:hypothetical protein
MEKEFRILIAIVVIFIMLLLLYINSPLHSKKSKDGFMYAPLRREYGTDLSNNYIMLPFSRDFRMPAMSTGGSFYDMFGNKHQYINYADNVGFREDPEPNESK